MRIVNTLSLLLITVSMASAGSSLSFTENKGQIRDQHFKPRPDVLYSGSANGLVYHLKKDGLHYQLSRVESWKEERNAIHTAEKENRQVPDKIGIYRVDVNWLNASKTASVSNEKEIPGYDHYYNVPDGAMPALFVKSFEAVRYKNIYKNIDLHFYHNKGSLEYDFIVQPHADYKQIEIEFKGAELEVSPAKELILKTPFGNIIEGALKVYQGENQIAAEWIIEGNVVSFHIPAYDPSKPLRIDPPVRVWGTYYGANNNDGTDWEHGNALSTDPNGNVYMCGNTRTLNSAAIATTGATYTTQQGERDAYLVKFDPNGQRLWGTYYGGSFEENTYACSTDANGNVYLVGETFSSNNIATPGAYQTTKGVAYDNFIVKFNSSGVRQWGTYYGGNGNETPYSSAVDNNGNIIISGSTGSTNVIATPGAHQTTAVGGSDVFVAKFNSNGSLLWGTYFGGAGSDYGHGCTTDINGNIIINGYTNSTSGIASPGAHQTAFGGGNNDCFVAKFGPNGNRLWSTYIGGNQDDNMINRNCRPATDVNGNVFVTGWTRSATGIATPGSFTPTYAGNPWDGFLQKYGPNGNLIWGTYFGSIGWDQVHSAASDAAGNIYITGQTSSATGIATPGVHQTTLGNTGDAFLAMFDNNGNRLWTTYYGGSGNDEAGLSIAIDNASNSVYMSGTTNSTNGIATTGAHQTTFGGGYGDAFLVKFQDCPPAGTVTPTTNAPICSGQNLTLSVPATTGATYQWSGPNGFTSTQQNPSITNVQTSATGMYNVTITANGCPGSSGSVQVTVNPSPAAPIASTLTPGVCKDSTATFQVTSAGTTFNWYATQTSTTILGTGTTFTSPPLTASTSYSVERVENGCPSQRTQVFVQVITAPDPTPANTQICAGTTATINSNISNAFTVNWYDAPSATTPVFTGSIFTTPTLNSNTTYYAQTFVSGCPSARVPVTVTVVTPPTAPAVSGTTICAGQTATLNATAPSGVTFAWFTAATGGTAVFTGNPFTTPVLNNNTTYYVEAQAGSCVSSRTAVVVTVNPSPAAPIANTLTPGVCKDSTATFQVTSAGTTFNWYATATSATILGTGTTFTSPPLTANTSYFVERIENGCPSQRTQVFVQVITAPDPTPANTQICAGTTATINSNISNAFTVNWYDAPSATTPVFTGSIFTTPTLNSNTTYYAQTFVSGCPSARVPVTVTVVTPPTAPAVSGTTICAGQTATLNATAPSGVTFAWFTAATGGTAVFTGNPFVTPVLNNNATYYVEAQIGSCNSTTRTSVVVNVNPTPAAPTAAGATICSGENATLNATAPANVTFNWYANATGGTPLQSNASFTTPVLTANTTYYVDANNGNCTSARTAVTVTVNQPPVSPTVAAVSICQGETATLTATAPLGATFNWYDAPNAGTLLQTGNTFTTPNLNNNTTYYVESFNGCTSARTSVLVTVNIPPVEPTSSDVTICSGQTATLTATAPAGVTFLWFDIASGGSILGSGNTFTTQPLNTNTTFYVASEAAGCPPSVRTPVTVNVEPTPGTPVVDNAAICSGETATLDATAPTGVSFEWFTTVTGGVAIQNGASYTTPILTSTTTYYVAAVLGNCASARTAVQVTVSQPPLLPTVNNATICEGETVTLSAASSAGATINWYDANTGGNLLFSGNDFTTPALTANTSYFVQAEAAGCPPTNSVEVIVTVLPTPASPIAADVTVCSGEAASLSATAAAGATIQWYSSAAGGIAISNEAIFTTAELLTTTTFYASAQLGNCPSSQRTPVVVNVLPTPEAAFSSEPELTKTVMVSQAEFTFFNNTLNGTRYVWSFGDGDSLETFSTQEVTHKYEQPGSYLVSLCAYTSDGCSNCISYGNITVVEDYAIYIPNAFTPNGDGNNDVFQYHLIGVKQAYILIYNRWGEKVFETDNPNEYWDGTYKGKLLTPDVFVYHIKLISYDNKQAEFKGSVTIVR